MRVQDFLPLSRPKKTRKPQRHIMLTQALKPGPATNSRLTVHHRTTKKIGRTNKMGKLTPDPFAAGCLSATRKAAVRVNVSVRPETEHFFLSETTPESNQQHSQQAMLYTATTTPADRAATVLSGNSKAVLAFISNPERSLNFRTE